MTMKQVILNEDFNSEGVNVMKRNLKTSDTIKVCNVQNVFLSGTKATTFDVYSKIGNDWIFDYNDSIIGWYKKPSTVLDKILK